MPSARNQRIAKCALLCALLVVSCFFTIPLGPVPFTLQTAVVILIALLCSPGEAFAVTGVYLLMGTVGLPVFSGMTGGIVRASAGFLMSYPVGTVLASSLRGAITKNAQAGSGKGALARRTAADVLAAAIILVTSDTLGWLWLMFFNDLDPLAAFLIADAPFIAIDILKAALSIGVAKGVRKGLGWE